MFCLHVCTPCAWMMPAHSSQTWNTMMLGSLKLELGTAVSHRVGAENPTWVFSKIDFSSCFLTYNIWSSFSFIPCHLLKGICYTYLLCVLCTRAMVYLGRSENNLRESVLSFTMWIPVIKHRLLDLAMGALTL